MEPYQKLVRDKIPDILTAKNVPYEKWIADDEEYKVALIEKLSEELAEFKEAGAIEELADILEVIEALRTLPEYKSVETVRVAKREERGGFDAKIIVKGYK